MPSDWLSQLGDRKRKAQQEKGAEGVHTSAGGSAAAASSSSSRRPPRDGRPGVNDLGDGAVVLYKPAAIGAEDASHLMDSLKKDVKWAERTVKIMGRDVMQPRKVAYMANDTTQEYTYSGARFMPDPWNPFVLKIKEEVERYTVDDGVKFNSCLLNYYRSGGDHIGWHSDDETLYGTNATIGSVSLGTVRDFVMRRISDHSDKIAFRLGPGDILIMKGTTQKHWQHCVPKRARLQEPRINLTFRRIVHRAARPPDDHHQQKQEEQ